MWANDLIDNFYTRKKSYACILELIKKKSKINNALPDDGKHVLIVRKYCR